MRYFKIPGRVLPQNRAQSLQCSTCVTGSRMLRWLVLLGAVVAALPNIELRAADSAPGDAAQIEKQVHSLIRQLDADTRKHRLEAAASLLRLGPKVLPLLPPPEMLPNATVRDAVRRLRIRLENVKARDSAAASLVTLSGSFPLSKLMEQITAQTGNPIESRKVPAAVLSQTLQIDFREQPFWQVMDEILKRNRLRTVDRADSAAIQLMVRKPTDRNSGHPVTYSGPFRIAVEKTELKQLFGDEAHRRLIVHVSLECEPRLRPLFLKYSANDVRAVASPNVVLGPFTKDAQYELPFGEGGRVLPLRFDFRVPNDLPLHQVSLEAKLMVETAAGEEPIVFTNLTEATGVARRRGGVTVTLGKLEYHSEPSSNRRVQIGVSVSYDTGGRAFESHRTWMFHNNVWMQNDDGRRIEYSGPLTTSLQTDGAVAVEYRFEHLRRDLADYQFVYVAPTLLIKVPVMFKLSNISVSQPANERKQP